MKKKYQRPTVEHIVTHTAADLLVTSATFQSYGSAVEEVWEEETSGARVYDNLTKGDF
jgi:hypothetical protein